MKIAKFKLSAELLCEVLHLPPGTMIDHVYSDPDAMPPVSEVVVVVTHHDLKELAADANEIPTTTPSWRNQQPVEFAGWGERQEATAPQ